MTCTEFVAVFSDYYDGTATDELAAAAEDHLAACESCRRYRHVVHSGAHLLRALPGVELREDFHPRLRHSLFHVDDGALVRRHTSSGTTVLVVAGIATFLSALAWSPTLRPSAPVVELAPIVVSAPAALRVATFGFESYRYGVTHAQRGLWEDAHRLFLEYSALSRRYSQRPALIGTGLEEDF
jgi:predicted anti-sigma-YlaC factor YlaD